MKENRNDFRTVTDHAHSFSPCVRFHFLLLIDCWITLISILLIIYLY